MSTCSLSQLSESYGRVIEMTLRRVREAGLLKEARQEVLDELGKRWRAAVRCELETMEKNQGCRADPVASAGEAVRPLDGGSALVPSEQMVAPSNLTKALRIQSGEPCRPMDGVSFAGHFALPTPAPLGSLPAAVQCIQGFASSNVERPEDLDVSGQVAPKAGVRNAHDEAIPARKKARKEAPIRHIAPPLVAHSSTLSATTHQTATVVHAEALVSPKSDKQAMIMEVPAGKHAETALAAVPPSGASNAASDDEYDGVFEDAEVIVSAGVKSKDVSQEVAEDQEDKGAVVPIEEILVSAPEEVHEASSAGSELNSELDISDFDEPESENMLYAELCDIKRSKTRWSLKLHGGVMRVNGVECLFSSGQGVFDVDWGSTTAGDSVGPEAAALEDDRDSGDDDDASADDGVDAVAGPGAASVRAMLPSRGVSRRQVRIPTA